MRRVESAAAPEFDVAERRWKQIDPHDDDHRRLLTPLTRVLQDQEKRKLIAKMKERPGRSWRSLALDYLFRRSERPQWRLAPMRELCFNNKVSP